jgi:predicted ATPase
MLLDEIEDGINPSLAANLISYLGSISQDYNKQIIVTTHSPVLLNYFNEDSIVFMWRKRDGSVMARKMFEAAEMREHLNFMNPGEVWLNLEQYELEETLDKESDNHDIGAEDGN